jgi:hypothetical protein
MKAAIVSYYMSNIHSDTVEMQKKVVEKFNKSKIPHLIFNGSEPHGRWMDYIHTTIESDLILFLDIDCVPVSENSIDEYLKRAAQGSLVGNAQRSGHLKNDNHVFAAPSALAISKETFAKIGRPQAGETIRSDVAEEYTFAAEMHGVKIDLFMPTRYDREVYRYDWEQDRRPYWTLENGLPNYGLGTTYGLPSLDFFWHNFQIRISGQQEHFRKKCEELLTRR